ncbi:MAG: hypothetical protein ACM3KL_01945 [Alphaproteobacteria bacterium]
MKKYGSMIYILSAACACLILIGCETTQPAAATAPPPNSGHLIIDRVANFGSNLGLVLSIDGKDVATLTEGQHYSGYLSAGQHRLTARVDPFQAGTSPTRKTLTIQAGQTYSYTASWSGQSVRFVKN